jgi:hypothetical protein
MLTSVINVPRSLVNSTIRYIASSKVNDHYNSYLNDHSHLTAQSSSAQSSSSQYPITSHLISHPWFYPAQPPVIVAFGEWIQQKSWQALLEAFAQIRSSQPVHLMLLGDIPQAESIETMIRQYQMEPWIALPGPVNNALDYLNHADVSVVPNRHSSRTQQYFIKINTTALHASTSRLPKLPKPNNSNTSKPILTSESPQNLASAIANALAHPSLNQFRNQRLAILHQMGLIE